MVSLVALALVAMKGEGLGRGKRAGVCEVRTRTVKTEGLGRKSKEDYPP